MHEKIFSELNPVQQEAVKYFDSPLLVVAGAGSGKTRIITHKIALLCTEQKVPPEQILALTFTNRAANEMRERVKNLCGIPAEHFYISTFHSLGAGILRQRGSLLNFNRQWQIIDDSEQFSILKKITKSKLLKPADLQNLICNAKINLLFVQDRDRLIEFGFSAEELIAFEEYQQYLQKNQLWDFEDLISFSYLLLKNYPAVRQDYRQKFQYILVDEYQDTNPNQYQLLKLLAAGCRQITVVGDDDQAIYSWRGAKIEYLLNFENDFPNTKIIKLEQNYRSSARIINLANRLIAENIKRHQKTMWTTNEDGWPPFFLKTMSREEETDQILKIVQTINSGHQELLPVAILLRTNSQTLEFEKKFNENKINFRILKGIGFFQRKEIKDLVSALIFINHPEKNFFFLRTVENFALGIGPKKLDELIDIANRKDSPLIEALKISGDLSRYELLSAFLELSGKLNSYSQQLEKLIELSGFYQKIEQHQEWERWENVQTLIEFIRKWEADNFDLMALADLINPNLNIETRQEKCDVFLLTMHSSKGLEFPTVIVAGANNRYLPLHYYKYNIQQLEEERRLFYVSLTRARKLLIISQGGPTATLFLTEKCQNCLQTVYDRQEIFQLLKTPAAADENSIDHPVFGKGHILNKIGVNRFLIRFACGEKIVDLSFIGKSN